MDSQERSGPSDGAVGRSSDPGQEVALVAASAARILGYPRDRERDLTARRGDPYGSQTRNGTLAAARQWEPALDAGWLRQADLTSVVRAWGAATLFADPGDAWHAGAAIEAMHACENRLRELNPHAMHRYDQLRSQGRSSTDSMSDAAPLFSRISAPHTPAPHTQLLRGDFPKSSRVLQAGPPNRPPATGPKPSRPTPARPGITPARRRR
jgi:hypothetical protein